MQKRIFLAISLPEDIKKRLFRFVEKEYRDLPVRWIRADNFHLTLNFLGYVAEENIPALCDSLREVTENSCSFELNFQKSEFGPNSRTKKMIWTTGEKSGELAELKYRLDKALGFRVREKREFQPHITLGRIRKEKWRETLPESDIERKLQFSVSVNSIEMYESKFEKGKRVYYVLESFPLDVNGRGL